MVEKDLRKVANSVQKGGLTWLSKGSAEREKVRVTEARNGANSETQTPRHGVACYEYLPLGSKLFTHQNN